MYDADDDLETPLLAEEGGEGDSSGDDESDDEEMTCGCPQTNQGKGKRFPIAMCIVLFCVIPFVHGFLKGFIKERNRIIVAREDPASEMDLDVALHKFTSEQVSKGLRKFESDLGAYDLTGDIIVEHMSFERAEADNSINSSVHADTSTSVFAATERGFPSFPSLDEPRYAQTE